MAETLLSPAIKLPRLLFATQHTMDDYGAPDMQYGDLSAGVLRQQYHLRDISARVDPFTHPNREESARILFDEFRDLSDMFSFYGDYKSLARTMITHMQYGNGSVFSDPLLDQAMAEHSSMKSSVNVILGTIQKYIDWERKILPGSALQALHDSIMKSLLPRFDDVSDRFNGLGITVHDTWATHISLENLQIGKDTFTVAIKYHIQDHFGLDAKDINNNFYRQFRIFRIWFYLQHINNYAFKPFISDIILTKTLSIGRHDKI
ncbi:MAG: YPO3983 family protein [Pantoea sp.]|nr:YPO3983 family protein [Pantoea sp.]